MRSTSLYGAGAILRFQVSMLSLADVLDRSEPGPASSGAASQTCQLLEWDEQLEA